MQIVYESNTNGAQIQGFHNDVLVQCSREKTPLYVTRAEGEDDDLEDVEWQNSIPSTFGKESDKLGRPLANSFGPGFLQRVASGNAAGTGVIGAALLQDDEIKSFVRKYAGSAKVGRGRRSSIHSACLRGRC